MKLDARGLRRRDVAARGTAARATLGVIVAALVLGLPIRSGAGEGPGEEPLDCATWLVRALERDPAARNGPDAARLLGSDRWDFPDSLETEHFLILHTLDPADPDHADADYVARLATYVEHAWDVYVHDPRFEMQPAFGWGPPGSSGTPLIHVRVMRLEGASGYARVGPPVPGTCPWACSGSFRIRSTLGDESLRTTSAHELWHIFSYAIDPDQEGWLEESTARWAEWQVWPDMRNLTGVTECLHWPYVPLWATWYYDPWPSRRMYGGGIFWQFLAERLGGPVAVRMWKRICHETDWLTALRDELAERHGADLDGLIVEFWQWNYRTGHADDGRHYANGTGYPRIGYQAIERVFLADERSLGENVLAQWAATNALLFLGPARRETLRIRFDGSPGLRDRRVLTLVATTWPNTHTREEVTIPGGDGDCTFVVPDWHLHDQVALLVTNLSSAEELPGELPFTWTAEETGAEVFDVQWNLSLDEMRAFRLTPAPSPFSTATQIRYRADAGAPTSLTVFDVLGRRVRALVRDRRDPLGGDFLVDWDGKDDAGSALPAGVYFLRLETGSFTESRRIGIVR